MTLFILNEVTEALASLWTSENSWIFHDFEFNYRCFEGFCRQRAVIDKILHEATGGGNGTGTIGTDDV